MKKRELLPRQAGLWIIAAASIFAAACASETTPTAPSEFGTGEAAVAAAVQRMWVVALHLREQVVRAGDAESISQLAPGRVAARSIVRGAEDIGCTFVAHYLDAEGRDQPGYDAAATARVVVEGACTASGTATDVDFLLDDARLAGPAHLVSGTLRGTYGGVLVHLQLKGLRIRSEACAEPDAGEVVARVEGVVVRVRFGEPAGATASYNRAGEEATFTIPLGECHPA